jgi:alkanesulfonate monooxygenase SsuD/methylene tetrahydromethanopterin reductase-like flavin-dependent oxidoreductase (luciferase family)
MSTFVMRFDFRSPVFGTPMADLYAAALDMVVFAEQHSFRTVFVSEHHMSEDGYLPSPIVLASAIVARTSRIGVGVSALIVPLYDPIRLAEDLAVLDHLSRGRVSYVVGIGYRPVEYEALGRDFAQRTKAVVEHIALMRRAWTGEPFEHEGRTIRVRPVPYTQPHPVLSYGGGVPSAARRAARLDVPFASQIRDKRLVQAYQDERTRLGLAPGVVIQPPIPPVNVFVSEDPEATWARIGEHLLHDARTYARWAAEAGLDSAVLESADSIDALRRGSVYAVLTPDECIDLLRRRPVLCVHPLCGGLPPEIGWETLHLIATKVQPALADAPTSAPKAH